jgi:AraC family transcriptional regulator of arabinose operon
MHLSQEYMRSRRGPVVVGDVLYKPGGIFGPRIQTDFQLVVIHRGSLRLKHDRKDIEVPKEHAILLCPGHREHFFFSPDSETRHSWVAIAPSAIAPAMSDELNHAPSPVPFFGRMAALLEMLRSPTPHREPATLLQSGLTLGLALALFCEFSSAALGRDKAFGANALVLSRLDAYLTVAYARPLRLQDMAQESGVSPQYLLKICRAAGRDTPMQQLYRKRLEAAADLLLHTGLPMSHISEQCGFLNPFHFSRKYKQFWGESPLSWRQKQWKARKGPSPADKPRRPRAARELVLKDDMEV